MKNRELYDKYDAPAKRMLWNILQQRGHVLVGDITQEHYKHTDIITEKQGARTKWEIQVRTQNNYNNLRNKVYPTFYVHTRKHVNASDYYVVFAEDYKEMGVIQMQHVKQSPVKRVRTKSGTYEDFFVVPLQHITFYKIHEDFTITKS